MNQAEFIHAYNDKHRPKFNNDLFVRTDDELIEAIRDIIYSCERDQSFTIKVLNFEVIDSYDEVNRILWEYEDAIINKGKKATTTTKKSTANAKKVNQFGFINLKDSDLKLIKITYFIQIFEKKDGLVNDTLEVYIAIPRIVNDFYFRINGNMYSAMYQIVDASTYNNSASKSKKQSITFKTVFTPIRVYRYSIALKDINGESIPCIYFIGNIFRKSLLLMKYIMAKFEYSEALNFMRIEEVNLVTDYDPAILDEYYVFPVRELYIVVPKVLYNSIQIIQSYVYTLWSVVNYMKDAPYEAFFTRDLWIKALGSEFISKDKSTRSKSSISETLSKDMDTLYDKGISILSSLEFTYDRMTMKDLKLPMEDKDNDWQIARETLGGETLSVILPVYNLSQTIATNLAEVASILDEGGFPYEPPMYLINAISKCQLVNYKNCVNDIDAIVALKYTYKGISGIGEKSNAISFAYRSIHPSHLGCVDIDSSSNSDPGVSGTICPLTDLHDKHFNEYQEPNTWESDLAKVMDSYKAINSKIEVNRIIEDHDLAEQKDNSILNECASVAHSLLQTPMRVQLESEYIPGYDIFGDGYFFVLWE